MAVTIPIAVLIGGCLGIAVLTGAVIIMAALLREGDREAERQQEEICRLRRVLRARPAETFNRHVSQAVAVANSVRWVEPTEAQLSAWSQQPGYDWRQQ